MRRKGRTGVTIEEEGTTRSGGGGPPTDEKETRRYTCRIEYKYIVSISSRCE